MKPLPTVLKTIGDWIYVKRRKANFTTSHVAAKMGIATALVQSWEDGSGKPNHQQLDVLAIFLGAIPDSQFPTDNGG